MKKLPKGAKLVFIIIGVIAIIIITGLILYLIPNDKNLQNIFTAIIAAVYGGILTLTGVAWTIRHNEKLKREDELAKAKPLFTFRSFTEINPIVNHKKVCLVDSNYTGNISYAELENSNNSSFRINKLYFDNQWHKAESNNIMIPNSTLLIQMIRKNIIERVYMEIIDIYSRKFYYDLMFIGLPDPFNPVCFTLAALQEISEQELNNNISKKNKDK